MSKLFWQSSFVVYKDDRSPGRMGTPSRERAGRAIWFRYLLGGSASKGSQLELLRYLYGYWSKKISCLRNLLEMEKFHCPQNWISCTAVGLFSKFPTSTPSILNGNTPPRLRWQEFGGRSLIGAVIRVVLVVSYYMTISFFKKKCQKMLFVVDFELSLLLENLW